MDQLIFASLSHTHYWYEVGMLKVPAVGGVGMFLDRSWPTRGGAADIYMPLITI